MEKKERINKNWKWIILLTSVFLTVFMTAYAFMEEDKSYAANNSVNGYYLQDGDGVTIENTYTMRKREDTFSIPVTDKLDINWSLSSSGILDIEGKETDTNGSVTGKNNFSVNALEMGEVTLTISVTSNDKPIPELTNKSYRITVGFSINEQITADNSKVRMLRLFREEDASDERNNRKALIMDYDESSPGNPTTQIFFGFSAIEENQRKYLNLTFGDARANQPNIEWRSGNEDIVSIDTTLNSGGGGIVAQGAGRTTLSVTWQDGMVTYQDEIYVFVRPKITIDGDNVGTDSKTSTGTPLQVTNGTKISVSVKKQANELVGIDDKLIWVIAKSNKGNPVLVRDSLGNSTKDYEDEANLEWINSENCYKVNAKAGTYFVQFFVIGTYKDFETTKDPTYCQCKPVNVRNGVYVESEFKNYNNRYVRLNVGGQFNFPEAFNITNSTFDEYFNVLITGVTNAMGDAVEGNDSIISFAPGASQKIINAEKSGIVTIKVTAKRSINASELLDIIPNQEVYITIIISDINDMFTLNYSDVEMTVGSELALWSVLTSDFDNSDEIVYRWETDDKNRCIEINNIVRNYASVKALKATETDEVRVILNRTQNGVTLSASCVIRVTEASVTPPNPPVSSDVHIFSDYKYSNPVTDDEAIIYGNGATMTIDSKKVNNKVFTVYTDILASYKYTVNSKGIVKASVGKVIVGITKTATKPEVSSKNKIIDTSASKIARAKIKNGQITVTAVGKESGKVYLWVIDTGNKGVSAYCPINVKMAPKKLEVQDTSKRALSNVKLDNGNSLDVYVTGVVSGSTKTDDCTYTATVDSKSHSYIQVSPKGDSGKEFTIKAIGLKNNKDTKVAVTFKCDQNNKKVKFCLTLKKTK